MVPVLGLVQISAHAMADRYMYLPAIGLYIAVSFGAWRIAEGSVAGRRALGAGVAIVLILLIGSAMRQTSYWHDGERLWCHAIAATGSTMTAEGGLAEFYRAAGRQDEAAEHFQRAVERGNHPDLLLNYGTILFEQRKYAEAEQIFRRALAAHPGSAVVASNLGAVLAEQGGTQEAIGYYLAAIDLDAKLLLPRLNLVRLLAQHGKFDEAAVQCRAGPGNRPRRSAGPQDAGRFIESAVRRVEPVMRTSGGAQSRLSAASATSSTSSRGQSRD